MHEKYIKTMIQSTTMAINASHDCKHYLSSKSPGADNSIVNYAIKSTNLRFAEGLYKS